MSDPTLRLDRDQLRRGRPANPPPLKHRLDADEVHATLPSQLVFQIVGTETVLSVPVRSTLILGRKHPSYELNPDLDLAPFHGYHLGVSRHHSMIRVQENQLVVRDLGTANGTYINGYQLLPSQEYPLKHGDELALGALRLQVAFVTEDSYASA